MFKIARNLLLASTLVATAATAAEKLSDKQIKEIENLELFKRVQINVKSAYDAGSVYLLKVNVRGGSDEIYLTKDKKYLIAGDVINTTNGEKLSVPADLSKVNGNEAFTYGTGKDEYVLFTDPECPYCKKFESYLPQIKDKVKIKVMFFPLDFHKNAKDISTYVMSKKDQDAMATALFNTTKDSVDFKNRKIDAATQTKLNEKLEKQINIGKELGVQGTPAVFDKDGNKVSWVAMLSKYGIKVQ